MEPISLVFILSIFSAGILSFFSPCILPVLPVYVGILSSNDGEKGINVYRKSLKVLAFVLGLSSSFFILGFGAGALGSLFNSDAFFIICGVVIILLGIHQTGLISINILQRQKTLTADVNNNRGIVGSFILGFVFSFGWTPCVGPILGTVLGISSQQGGALTGGLLLLVYSLGLIIPFVVLAIGASFFLAKIKGIYKHLPKIKIVGGLLIIAMGVFMIFNQVKTINLANKAGTSMQSNSSSGFELNDSKGNLVKLSDYQGKIVYVKFWATWCPSCLAGLEDFKELAKQYEQSEDVVILSIVAPEINGEMSKEDFESWAKAQGLEFKVLYDETDAVNKKFGIRGYPTSIVFDKKGNTHKTMVGHVSNEDLKEIFSQIK